MSRPTPNRDSDPKTLAPAFDKQRLMNQAIPPILPGQAKATQLFAAEVAERDEWADELPEILAMLGISKRVTEK